MLGGCSRWLVSRWLGFMLVAVSGPWLSAPAVAGPVLLFEPATGQVLYAEEPDRSWHPASVTKMLTAYLTFEAVQSGRIAWDSEVPLSEHARAQPATRIGLRGGIKINVEQAVRGLILRSANDFATALAERIGGTEAAFVDAMNATARRIGMTRSVFRNPHGLPDAEQVTTARDLALLTRALLQDFPDRIEVFSTPTVRIHKGSFHSQNDLLRTFAGGDGLKTGFTCASGYNVVASATRDGRRLVAIVLGATHRQLRSQRATELLEAGFAHFGIPPPPAPHIPAGQIASLAGSVGASSAASAAVRLAGATTLPAAVSAPALPLIAVALVDLPVSPTEAEPPQDIGRQVRTGKCRGYSGFRKPEADLVVSETDDEAGEAAPVVTGALPGTMAVVPKSAGSTPVAAAVVSAPAVVPHPAPFAAARPATRPIASPRIAVPVKVRAPVQVPAQVPAKASDAAPPVQAAKVVRAKPPVTAVKAEARPKGDDPRPETRKVKLVHKAVRKPAVVQAKEVPSDETLPPVRHRAP